MHKIECTAKIIVASNGTITIEDILELEQYLNGAITTMIWDKLKLGMRFHVNAPNEGGSDETHGRSTSLLHRDSAGGSE